MPAPPRALELTARGLFLVATGLVLLIVVLILAQIVARNLWNLGLPRAEELSRLAGILAVYMTAPMLALHGQHVAVDAFTGLMPRLPRLACAILAEAATLGFSLMTLWGGWLYLRRAWKFRTSALGMQNIWYFGPVMLCFALIVAIAGWRIAAAARAGRAAR
ncbi:TRAP transporter small permease [Frigidibacter sp. MR17.24]|uniref:TRAP transporter small permease n=1 Tax=Frigidibacter sp. MR17.24 TaxID=3127345 RepID=UPI003012D970